MTYRNLEGCTPLHHSESQGRTEQEVPYKQDDFCYDWRPGVCDLLLLCQNNAELPFRNKNFCFSVLVFEFAGMSTETTENSDSD